MSRRNSCLRVAFCVVATFAVCLKSPSLRAEEPAKLKALLILGGCCHEYDKQKDVLKTGLEAKIKQLTVDIVYNKDSSVKARFECYENPDWAKGYDVVIHDECSSDVKDMPYVDNILNAHKGGVAAVNLHCAMHSYRIDSDEWFKFVGIQSARHGPQEPIEIIFDRDHPIAKKLENWTTINEELYNNLKVFKTARPFAQGKQVKDDKDFVVAWTNQFEKGRVFSTTLGHNTATVADDRYLELVTRGLLWACDKPEATYLVKP